MGSVLRRTFRAGHAQMRARRGLRVVLGGRALRGGDDPGLGQATDRLNRRPPGGPALPVNSFHF